MKKKRRAAALLLILFGVFLLLNTTFVGKLMYPVDYQEEVEQAARKHGVDPILILAIVKTESNFDKERVSHKGAVGLMQLMPDTADWIISQSGYDSMAREYLDHPQVNIDLGTWYVAFLLDTFQGDQVKAVAAYNAGPGIVAKWLKEGRWQGTRDSIDGIPYGETRHFVQRVLYFYERYDRLYRDDF